MNFPKPPVGMLPNDRLSYSPISSRKPLKLPNGARMVVWTITNVEEWDPTQTLPRTVITPPADWCAVSQWRSVNCIISFALVP